MYDFKRLNRHILNFMIFFSFFKVVKIEMSKRNFEPESEVKKTFKINHEVSAAFAPPLSSNQIKEMMAKAQRDIEERKRKIGEMMASKSESSVLDVSAKERQRKIDELRRNIQAKISGNLRLITPLPGTSTAAPDDSAKAAELDTDKPRLLILNEEGQTVDITGRKINIHS